MDIFYNLNVQHIIFYVLSAFLVGSLLFYALKFIFYILKGSYKKKKKVLKK